MSKNAALLNWFWRSNGFWETVAVLAFFDEGFPLQDEDWVYSRFGRVTQFHPLLYGSANRLNT
jgi:hypothetical protein